MAPRYSPLLPLRLRTTTETNLLLHGTRIVMPQALRSRTLDTAHQGVIRNKTAASFKVWWPRIDKDAEKLRDCLTRQATGPAVSNPRPNAQTAYLSTALTSHGFLWPFSHGRNAVHRDRRVFQISWGRNHAKHNFTSCNSLPGKNICLTVSRRMDPAFRARNSPTSRSWTVLSSTKALHFGHKQTYW